MKAIWITGLIIALLVGSASADPFIGNTLRYSIDVADGVDVTALGNTDVDLGTGDITTTGAVSVGTVTETGGVTGTNATYSGTVSANNVTATDTLAGDDASITNNTAIGGTLDVDGNTDLDLLNVSETLDVDGDTTLDAVAIAETLDVDGDTTLDAVVIAETLDVTTVATSVTGVTNSAYITAMQLIADADAVSGSEEYILNDAVLNETENVYTTWANELTDDVPRAIVVDPAASYTGTVTIYGTDIADAVISEVLTFSSDAAQTTAAAFKDLTNITVSARTGGGDTTMDVGLGSRLGLNTALTDAAQVAGASMDNVYEATRPTVTVSATTLSLNTVDPNTANDGSKDLEVYMRV